MTRRPVSALALMKRTFSLLRPHRGLLSVGLALTALAALSELAPPMVTKHLLDAALAGVGLKAFLLLAGSLVAAYGAHAAFAYLQSSLIAAVSHRVVADLRQRLFESVQRMPVRRLAQGKTGETVSRIMSDLQLIQESLAGGVAALVRHSLTVAIGTGILFAMDPLIAACALAALPTIAFVGGRLGRRIRLASRQVQERLADAAGFLTEAVAGIRDVKSFTLEGVTSRLFQEKNEAILRDGIRSARTQAKLSSWIVFAGSSATVLVAGLGSYRVATGAITPGELAAFFLYVSMMSGPLGALTHLYGNAQRMLAASERVFEILDAPSEEAPPPSRNWRQPPCPIRGEIRFESVSFAYVGANDVLREVSFRVSPGETVALVGVSGAGKSTLLNLLLAYERPREGVIRIDGVDASSVNPRELRRFIGLVPQEAMLFGRSIRENIACGRPGASRGEIIAAARAANAHEFIMKTEHGYETVVGERGMRLSGGQRQRIAIARVLLKNPPILLLDEATSALDAASERDVQEALERLRRNRTTLIIAHRLSTIRRADRILVLESGRIAEEGRHEELLRRGGLYARLYGIQAEGAIKAI